VLDLGCGTGTLVVELAERHPGVEVVGIDPDPKALARARRKAERAGTRVRFDRGFADALPYDDASFDRVLSSFMLHHLDPRDRENALREVARVLKPGGRLHLLDFVAPGRGVHGLLARLFHRHQHDGRGHFEVSMLDLLGRAGFVDAAEDARSGGLLLSIAYHSAVAPARAA
jgi:ubiquinone/menaquinone biosynthesis C-methylase UbiE